MAPKTRSLTLLAALLALLIVVLWLGKSMQFRENARTHGPQAGKVAEAAGPDLDAAEAGAPQKNSGSQPVQPLSATVPITLTSRLSIAKRVASPVESRKVGSPANGLPVELKQGRIVERRESTAGSGGKFRRATVYQTAFKYPFLRVEQEIVRDARGGEMVTAQLVMVADHLLVKLQPDSDEALLRTHLSGLGARVLSHLPNSPFYTVALRDASVAEFDRALAALEATPGPIVYAEPDYISLGGGAPVIPNDPSFGLQWDLHNTGQNGGTPNADIHAPEAWSVTLGSANVVVAVIDTGIDLTHPDLAANVWTNPGESGGGKNNDGIDNDGNGYIDDVNGWNFYAPNTPPMDDHGHGSHTGGTVGAVGGNGAGISGVSQTVRIMPLKFLSADGSGTDSDAIAAIHYATANGALLSSNSWGGAGPSQALFEVIKEANAAGVGFIAAAGNSASNDDLVPFYPANFEVANVISVAATDNTDTLAGFSSYGATTVHLGAPGAVTYSTYKNGGYAYMSGTSMATPHVAGAAALLKAANPNLTFAQIKGMLITQCDAQPSLAGKTVSGGRLNVAKALVPATSPLLSATTISIDDDPAHGATGNADHIASPGETVNVIIPLQNIGAFSADDVQGVITLKNNGSGITLTQSTSSWGSIASGATATNTLAPFVISIAANKAPSDVILTLALADSQNHTWTQDLTLQVRLVATLGGTVTKVTGGAGLGGATIEITGPETHAITTAPDGTYSIVLTNGTYTVRAKATGYISSAPQTLTVPPSNTNVNFALGYSQGLISPPALSSTQNEGEIKTQTITITNNGDQALTYKIFEVPPAPPGNFGPLSINPPPNARNATPSSEETAALRVLPLSRLSDASDNSMTPLPFADGFEDGMWGRWFPSLNDNSTREVVGNTAGLGAKSFHFHSDGPDGHLTGIEQVFQWGSQPGYVNFWVRPGPEDLATGYTVLGDVFWVFDGSQFVPYLADFIWFFANANGRFYLNDNVGGNQSVAYTQGQWYHIEFRNIDWTAKNFDYWVDGQLIQAGVPFRNPGYASEMIFSFHYNYSGGTDAWWDEFKFSDSELPWLNLSSRSGSVPPGNSVNINVSFNASSQLAGNYTGSLLVQTNDPVTANTSIPVSMTVNALPNNPPVAVSQSLTLGLNETKTITLGGSDADGDPLICKIIALPAHGALYQTQDGVTPYSPITNTPTVVSHPLRKVIFKPAAGESGSPYASFGFVLHDPKIDSAPATIGIDVTPWPSLTVTPPGADSSFDPVTATFTTSDPLAEVRLTLDGTTPTASSLTLANGGSFMVDHQLTITASTALGAAVSPPQSFVFNITDSNHNNLPDWWEAQHPGVGLAGTIDPAADDDGDGLTNMKEFIMGTDPAVVDTFIPTLQNPPVPLLVWSSITGRLYGVETSTDLVMWQEVSAPRPGTGGVMTWQEPHPVTGPRFYQVKVTLP